MVYSLQGRRIRDRGKGKKDLTSANLSNTKPYIQSLKKPFIKTKKGDKKKALQVGICGDDGNIHIL